MEIRLSYTLKGKTKNYFRYERWASNKEEIILEKIYLPRKKFGNPKPDKLWVLISDSTIP